MERICGFMTWIVAAAAFGVCSGPMAAQLPSKAVERPNVVVILADDKY